MGGPHTIRLLQNNLLDKQELYEKYDLFLRAIIFKLMDSTYFNRNVRVLLHNFFIQNLFFVILRLDLHNIPKNIYISIIKLVNRRC